MSDHSKDREEQAEDEDPEEVRLKAFALLNRIGPAADDDASTWPEKPTRQSFSSYQKNVNTKADIDQLRRNTAAPAHYARNEYYEEWGMAGLMVSCIADACKKSANYAIRGSGYDSIYYPDAKEANEDFEKVSILNTYRDTGQTSGET